MPYFTYSLLLLLICIGQTLNSVVTLTHFLPKKSNNLNQWESLWCQSGQRLILHRDSHMIISCSHWFRSPFSNILKRAPNCKPMQVPFSFSIAFFCNICADGSHIFQTQQILLLCLLFPASLLPTHKRPFSCFQKYRFFLFFPFLVWISLFSLLPVGSSLQFHLPFPEIAMLNKTLTSPSALQYPKIPNGPLRRKAIGQNCCLWYWNRAGSNIYRLLWKLQGWLVAKNDDIHPLFF